MSVTEGLMKQGDWSLKLKPETPYAVRSALGVFGHLVITPERIAPAMVNDTSILTAPLARYSGIVLRIARQQLSGSGLARWLGDESGKGPGVKFGATPTTFSAATSNVFGTQSALSSGFISSAPTGTMTYLGGYSTARAYLDFLCGFFGTEWRVKPHAFLDIALASELFVTTPTAVVTRYDLAGELTMAEVKAAELNAEVNAEEYASALYYMAAGEGGAISATFDFITPPYYDLHGNRINIRRFVNAPATDATSGTELAAAVAAAKAQYVGDIGLRRAVTLSSTIYDIGRTITVGDTIYVYDPDQGLIDAANQIQHQGRRIFPIKLRVLGYSWPIGSRYGVFFRSGDGNGTWTDLTPWVEPEDGPTTIDVGAAPTTLTNAAEGRVSLRALEERQSR